MAGFKRFFFIGPERTGTTWIHELLSTNANICLPFGTKETFFFDQYYHKGINWYNKHFEGEKGVTIEVAPTYFKSDQAPYRIKKHFPDAKLICTFRNPLDRAISHFNHLIRYGECRPVFSEAIEEKPEIIEASLYYKNLVRWINIFGKENIYVIFYDQLKDEPGFFAHEICRILNVDFIAPSEALIAKKVNPITVPQSIVLASIGNRLKTFFRGHRLYWIVELAKRMGLKKIFFGKESADIRLPDKSELDQLINLFSRDLEKLNQIVSYNVQRWIEDMNQKLK